MIIRVFLSIFYFFQLKDCGPKGDCENYKCVLRCKNSQDCQEGEFCAKRRCIPPNCNKESDCGLGNKCISKKCIIGCKRTGDCPEGKTCNDDDYCFNPPGNLLCDLDFYLNMTNQYASNSGGPCKEELECGIDVECINGKCPDDCVFPKDCSKRELCQNLKCIPMICQKNTDCAGRNPRCLDRKCIIACKVQKDCPKGRLCTGKKARRKCLLEFGNY